MKKKLPSQEYECPVFFHLAGIQSIKVLFLLLVSICYQTGTAQLVEVSKQEAIATSSAGGYFHPVFSPTSDYLVCTDINYKGLQKISLTDGKIQKLTEANGAGYKVNISDDGLNVLYRNVQLKQNRKYTALNMLNLSNGKSTELIAPTREAFTPAFSGNQPFFVKGTKLDRKTVPFADLKPVIQIEDRKMVIYSGNNRRIFTPNGESESYIWPSFSPDGSKIVYTVAGKGTFISTVDGKNVQSLGKLSAPKWLNNNIVIGMDDKYFGQELISSEIIAVSIDGKTRQTLATDKAIYPAPSSDARKVAFSNNEGQLFILNINIK
jgi:Tol biopolymer transport system component